MLCRVKKVQGYGVVRSEVKYEDIAKIARESGMFFAMAKRVCYNIAEY